MELREILLVLHIAGAATWFGANVVQALAPSMAARQSPEAAAGWYRVAGRLSSRLYMPASLLILASGIWMVVDNEAYGFDDPFVAIGFGVIIIGALFGIFVFGPGSERAAQAIESGDQAAIRSSAARIAAFGTADTLLVLFAITAMVLRLGA